MALAAGRVRPTRGFLLQLKRRLKFMEEGYELLKMKRDELVRRLQAEIKELKERRELVRESIKDALDSSRRAYTFLGSYEVNSQAACIEKMSSVEVLPMSVMGVMVPYIKSFHEVDVKGKLGAIVRIVAKKFSNLLRELIRIAEVEARAERLAYELERTNRTVNSLEKVLIPQLKKLIHQIEDILDEETLEEFIRTKLIRNILTARRVA